MTMQFSRVLASAIFSLGALYGASRTQAAGDLKFQSRAGQRTSLVELYTSEGCSSCPPAEAWLSQLDASPGLWTEIVPVAFHVDYWDNLGWRDRFAAPAWSARQRTNAAHWGSDSVYTPGLVLDGREWRDWSGYQGGARPPGAGRVEGAGQLSVTVHDGTKVTVAYRPTDRPAAAREVSVALLGCDLNSNVQAGENRGRALRHDFVALACETKPLPDSPQTVAFNLPVPSAEARRLALAVWVEEPGRGGIEQAGGSWLTIAPAGRP